MTPSDLTISEEELEGVRHHLREHGWGEIGDEICALARRSLHQGRAAMEILENLGLRVREKRGQQSIRAAAKEIGISHATLSRVERGYLPDLERYEKICKWLGVGVETGKPRQDAAPWQPIETAPKDGTHVLLYWPTMSISSYPLVGFHHGDEYGWEPVADRDYGEIYPTHWMPLPEPPK